MLISSVLCTSTAAQTSPEQEITVIKKQNDSTAKNLLVNAKKKNEDKNESIDDVVDDKTEVIQVYGIRGSLIKSIAIKRQSVNIVDAISAEDIGKLPDVNIADALSRISGITVNRDPNTGQAQSINVRGLSGEYNVTTLNGRKLATTNSGRDFHYDVLSSGIISSVEVAKSPLAHMASGGIGASVDIKTVRPLTNDETEIVFKFDDFYQELSGNHNPKFSIYSNYNHESEFGIAAGLIYSKTGNRVDTVRSDGIGRDGSHSVQGEDGEFYNVQADNFLGMNFQNGTTDQERLSANLSLQWVPVSELDVTLDVLYSTFDQRYQGSSIALSANQPIYANHGTYTQFDINELLTPRWDPATGEARLDDNDEVVYLGIADQITIDDLYLIDLANTAQNRNTETQSFGLNASYDFDTVTLAIDLAHSSAVDKNQGDNYYIVTRSGIQGAKFDFRTDNLMPDVILSENLNAAAGWGAHYNRFNGIGSEDKVDSLKLDGVWLLDTDYVVDVKFGAGVTRQTKFTDTYTPQVGGTTTFRNGTILGAPITDQTQLLNRGAFSFLEIPEAVMNNGNIDKFLSNEPGNFPRQWASFDVNDLLDFYRKVSPEAVALMEPIRDEAQTYTIEELVGHLYLETNLQFDIYGQQLNLNLGGRYVEIDIDAEGKSQRADRIARDFLGNPIDEHFADETRLMKEAHQHFFLPSMTVNLKLFDDYVVKVAAAKTVSRPTLSGMKPYETINASSIRDPGFNSITRSNPALQPYSAVNVDVSFEWYFSELGALALGLFYKDIDGFVQDEVTFEEIDGWEFQVTSPVNNDQHSKIKGLEVLLQQSLDDYLPESLHGFGYSANYTYTDTGNGDTNAMGWEVGFVGMSKSSYNFQIFYDIENFSTRIAFQHRDEYLKQAAGHVLTRDIYVPESDYVTWSMSYDFSDSIGITAAVNNVTNESNKQVSRELWGDNLTNLSFSGRNYNFGLKAKF